MKNTIIGIDKTGSYRVYAAVTTEPVSKAEEIHQSSSPHFGMVLTAAGLMGLMLKGSGDKLSLLFKDKENTGEILAAANALGQVKGYISKDSLQLKGGQLTVIKDLGLKEPYVGKILLETGNVSQDLVRYFAISEQQPSAVVLVPNAGIIVQVLPDADPQVIDRLEERLVCMDDLSLVVSDAAQKGIKSDMGILREVLQVLFKGDVEVLDEREISWLCPCSKERMAAALLSIGKKDLAQIIEEDGKAELTCSFCKKNYTFSKEELLELLRNA